MALKRCVTSEEYAAIKAKEKEISNLLKGGAASKASLPQLAEKQNEVNTQIEQVKVEAKKKYVEYTLTGFLPIALPSKSYKRINLPEIWDDKKKKWTSPWLGPTILIQREQTVTGAGLSVYLEKYGTYRRRILNGLATVESNGVSTPTGDNDWPYVVDADGDPTLKIRWTILIEDENVEKDLQEEVDKLIKAKESHPTFNTLAAEIEADFAEFVPEITATIAKLREEYGIPIPPVQTAPVAAAAYGDIGANSNIAGLSNALDNISAIASIANNPGAALAGIAANAFANTVGGVIGNVVGGLVGGTGVNIQDPQNLLTGTVGNIVGGITGGLAGAVTGALPGAGDLIAGLQADNPSSFVSSIPVSELDICKAIPKKKITKTPTGEKIVEDLPPQPKEPTAEQSQQPSIKQEETIVETKETPVSTTTPEAVIVDDKTNEPKPVTRSLAEIETELNTIVNKLIEIYFKSITGLAGSVTLTLKDDYSDIPIEAYFSKSSSFKFLFANFDKQKYKVIKKKFRDYRNEEEGIKKKTGLLSYPLEKQLEFAEDAGITEDEEELWKEFHRVKLELERVRRESTLFRETVDYYMHLLGTTTKQGKISVFGDIGMPLDFKLTDEGFDLKNPTKFIGTASDPDFDPENGGGGYDRFPGCPEGDIKRYMINQYQVNHGRANSFILDTQYGLPYKAIMSAERAAYYFGIMLPDAMLYLQQNKQVFLEFAQIVDTGRVDILPSPSRWKDIAGG